MLTAGIGQVNERPSRVTGRAAISGTVSTFSGRNSFPQGLAGITVDLLDSSGNILASTVRNSAGHYQFNQQSGISATGAYTVRLVGLSASETSIIPQSVQISRGGIDASGVNFLVQPARKICG